MGGVCWSRRTRHCDFSVRCVERSERKDVVSVSEAIDRSTVHHDKGRRRRDRTASKLFYHRQHALSGSGWKVELVVVERGVARAYVARINRVRYEIVFLPPLCTAQSGVLQGLQSRPNSPISLHIAVRPAALISVHLSKPSDRPLVGASGIIPSFNLLLLPLSLWLPRKYSGH